MGECERCDQPVVSGKLCDSCCRYSNLMAQRTDEQLGGYEIEGLMLVNWDTDTLEAVMRTGIVNGAYVATLKMAAVAEFLIRQRSHPHPLGPLKPDTPADLDALKQTLTEDPFR